MRRVETQMLAAIAARTPWRSGNTRVEVCRHGAWRVYLFDNLIAQRYAPLPQQIGLMLPSAPFYFTMAGHPTRTTRSRLNALAEGLVVARMSPPRFVQRGGSQYQERGPFSSNRWLHPGRWYAV